MHNLSMAQALSLWSELERAYYDRNGFGGDTAELYAYRFVPYSPAAAKAPQGSDGLLADAARDQARQARGSLIRLLDHFKETHQDIEIFVDGMRLMVWRRKTAPEFHHRVHVRIEHANED